MSHMLRFYAENILSELNHATRHRAIAKAKRNLTRQGAALGVLAFLSWAIAIVFRDMNPSISLICFVLCVALTFAMFQAAANQVTLGRAFSENT